MEDAQKLPAHRENKYLMKQSKVLVLLMKRHSFLIKMSSLLESWWNGVYHHAALSLKHGPKTQ